MSETIQQPRWKNQWRSAGRKFEAGPVPTVFFLFFFIVCIFVFERFTQDLSKCYKKKHDSKDNKEEGGCTSLIVPVCIALFFASLSLFLLIKQIKTNLNARYTSRLPMLSGYYDDPELVGDLNGQTGDIDSQDEVPQYTQ